MRTKVAFCLWGDRIAPRYDRSQMVRIVTLEGNTVVHETTLAADHLEPTTLCKAVAAQEVGTLICGGVLDQCRRILARSGVVIIDNIIGSPHAVLDRFLAGTLSPGTVVD